MEGAEQMIIDVNIDKYDYEHLKITPTTVKNIKKDSLLTALIGKQDNKWLDEISKITGRSRNTIRGNGLDFLISYLESN